MLVFTRAGAYSVTEGISLFLSRDLPAVYLHRADEFTELRSPRGIWTLNSQPT